MTIIERRADVSKIIDAVEREKRNATIEECAAVAHKAILDNGGTFELAHDAMNAIRALKDKL